MAGRKNIENNTRKAWCPDWVALHVYDARVWERGVNLTQVICIDGGFALQFSMHRLVSDASKTAQVKYPRGRLV